MIARGGGRRSKRGASPFVPPWETLVRLDRYAASCSSRAQSANRFHRRFLIFSAASIVRAVLYLLFFMAVAVTIGELFGFGADLFGDTLPIVVALAVASEVLTRVFERLLGSAEHVGIASRIRALKTDVRLIAWYRSGKKVMKPVSYGAFSEVGLAFSEVFRDVADPVKRIWRCIFNER